MSAGDERLRWARASTIAIDGPAGAGKSTIGAGLAARLGYAYYDSGVLYRAVTLLALRRGVDLGDEAALTALAAGLDLRFAAPAVADGRQMTVQIGGEDITWALRGPEVNEAVSPVAAQPGVRQALLERQREVGRGGRVVMVGRDIGTTVLPEADLKVYLEASAEERARRRHREELARGQASDLEAVLATVRRRDEIDTRRAASPLRPAADALRIDTDPLTADEVLARILALVDRAPDPSLAPGR